LKTIKNRVQAVLSAIYPSKSIEYLQLAECVEHKYFP